MVPERVSSTAFLTSLLLGVWGCLSSTQECPILPSTLRSPWPHCLTSLTLGSGAPASSTGSAQAQSHEGPSMTLGRSRGSAPSAWGLTPRQTHLEMAGSAGADPTVPSLPAHCLTCGYSQVKVKVGKDQFLLCKQPISKHGQVSQGSILLSLSHLMDGDCPTCCVAHDSVTPLPQVRFFPFLVGFSPVTDSPVSCEPRAGGLYEREGLIPWKSWATLQ